MKKITRLTALLMVVAMMFVMVGCKTKTYTSVEEWFDDNRDDDTFVQASVYRNDGAELMDFEIRDNDLVYKVNFKQSLFGGDATVNALVKTSLDIGFEAETAGYDELINEITKDSGVDVSLIHIVYEFYDANSTTPFYTYIYPKH